MSKVSYENPIIKKSDIEKLRDDKPISREDFEPIKKGEKDRICLKALATGGKK